MRTVRKRQRNNLLRNAHDDNPMTLFTNLFDVAMVLAVALMVAIVTHLNMGEMFSGEDFTVVKNPGTDKMEIITKKNGKIIKMKANDSDASPSAARGERLGTAYRLENGDIIYIPE